MNSFIIRQLNVNDIDMLQQMSIDTFIDTYAKYNTEENMQLHLQEHFNEEEQILAPHLPPGNELLQQMLDEHQEIEAMIHINENIPDESLLAKLAQSIDDHIRFEERQLFPYAEKVIPEKELSSIYEQLLKEAAQCKNWDNEFWKNK